MDNQSSKNLIYRSVEKDSQSRSLTLKTRSCNVEYYTVHELEPLDIIIGELLQDSEYAQMQSVALGQILGFDVDLLPENGMYYDEAEDNLYHKLLCSVQEWGIIIVDEKNGTISLTDLGRVCLQNKKKYKFFSAKTDAFEFIDLRATDNDAVSLYPFYSELGLSLSLDNVKTLKYENGLCDFINNKTDDTLVNNLKLQIPDDIFIYKAELTNYLGLRPIKLDVELYEIEGKYSLHFINFGKPCPTLNFLFDLETNTDARERKVEQCLYYRLINDPDVVLNYKALQPFEDIIEYDLLIEDSRLVWSDSQLLQLIISQCDADRWHALSKHCDVEVLKTLIPQYIQDLDWGTLTLRFDNQFIANHSKDYPWDKYLLLARTPVEKDLIQQFLVEHTFPEGMDDDQWNWDDVLPVVGFDFIVHHLDDIPFDLSTITKELEDAQRHYIVENPNARWDWYFIVTNYPIDFLLSNIDALYPYINMQSLLQRIFTDPELSCRYATNQSLKDCILLSKLSQRFNANTFEYIWNDDVIELFETCGLISWPSTTYKSGFECNPYLIWDESFFKKYNKKITTTQGWIWVSRHITNATIVETYPEISWNKIALSQNPVVYNNLPFITTHWDILDVATIIMSCDSTLIEGLYKSLFDKKLASTLLATSLDIQKRLLANLSVKTILDSYSEGWDKTLFTERICQYVALEKLDEEPWKDILDWHYLTEHLPINDIQTHFISYIEKWHHNVFANRITGIELLTDDFIITYAETIAELNLGDSIWPIITSKFSASELISLVKKYDSDLYQWNYAYMYNLIDFPSKEYIEQHTEDVHWSEFSESAAANKLFSKTGANKTQSLWLRIYEDILNNEKYQWDFVKLTKQPNILKLPKLFMLKKSWDWGYISEHATWISTQKGRNYYFKLFSDSLDFDKLSYRTDIELTEKVIEKFDKKKQWNWEALVQNESICFSFEFIDRNEDKPWDWHFLSRREGLPFDVVINHKEKDWDWHYLSTLNTFMPTVELLTYISDHGYEIDWYSISENENITREVIDSFKEKINWSVFVNYCPALFTIATMDFLKQYKDIIPWKDFNERLEENVSTEMLYEFADRLNWKNVSKSQKIKFTKELVCKYEDKWYWPDLFQNAKMQEDIPNYKIVFASHRNIVTFTERIKGYRDNPCIYHFTHFYNAIDVIRSRKILSRDRAEEMGLLKYDSAGSVVFRSSKAHKYARFYFRPCTPTQYYNEALGADSQLGYYNYRDEWKSKYPKAKGMGLPKCPVPVFFKFDLSEVLAKMPDKCFYSDRNMQSDDPNVYQVIDKPEFLGLDYLYRTMEDAYRVAKPSKYSRYNRDIHLEEISKVIRYSQQEFLVLSEFDFSEINSFKIICYDNYYAYLLKKIFADDPISEKIVTDDYEHLFERENRRLYLSSSEDTVSLSTNFRDEYYFSITSEKMIDVEFDLSNCEIIVDTNNELRVKGDIKWKKTDVPFDITFVDPNARTKEWLIYSNENVNFGDPKKYKINTELKQHIDSFLSDIENISIQLGKELFFPNMLYSYHGIAHTARVVFATHILVNGIGLSIKEKEACYVAATIHDLGKRSDREGPEHGYNSMLLYKDAISSLIPDKELQERVLNAVRYHSVDDDDCPNDVQEDILWKILKDADAMDRSRFGGRGLDVSYLRLDFYKTEMGESILDLMNHLSIWTHSLKWDHPYEELIEQIYKFIE